MKTSRTLPALLSVFAAAFFLISACKGPQGDTGPAGTAGPQGAAGTIGATGAQGPMGNANVVYTEWKTPAWEVFFGPNSFFDRSQVQFGMNNTASSVLTKDAIDKAVITVYYKINEVEYTGTDNDYRLVERIVTMEPNGVINRFKIPGRQTSLFNDFGNTTMNQLSLGVNYFKPYTNISIARYNGSTNSYDPIPELANKTEVFYRDLIKTLPQYRIVIVYGNVKGRQAVDFKDYAAVKKAYNLLD